MVLNDTIDHVCQAQKRHKHHICAQYHSIRHVPYITLSSSEDIGQCDAVIP